MNPTRPEPRTKAGRALLVHMEVFNSRSFPLTSAQAILAIEEEARAEARPTVEQLAEALHARCIENWKEFAGDFTQHFSDAHLSHARSALAALDRAAAANEETSRE